jgi:hypothetical protein
MLLLVSLLILLTKMKEDNEVLTHSQQQLQFQLMAQYLHK